MKTLANRMMLIAAGALTLGVAAYGQTAMTAKIPFEFRASHTTMPAGDYLVTERNNSGVLILSMRNAAANRTVMVAGSPVDWFKTGKARITFQCLGKACSLSQVRSASGTVTYPAPRTEHGRQVVSVVSIPLIGE